MHFFRSCLRPFLTGVIVSAAISVRAQTPAPTTSRDVTVTLRPSSVPRINPSPNFGVATAPLLSLAEWESWANLQATGGILFDAQTEPSLPSWIIGYAVKRRGTLGVALANFSSPARIRFETELGPGLWRVEAALLPFPPAPSLPVPPTPNTDHTADTAASQITAAPTTTVPKAWRLQSIVRPDFGTIAKTLPVPAQHTLLLRCCDTIAEANAALGAARAALSHSQNAVMRPRVGAALDQIEDEISALPVLAARGDCTKIIKRTHTALLTVGKAQAVWRNWREPGLEEDDKIFDRLVTALSEVSCAACNLVPSQTVVSGPSGKPILRVSVTNAGTRTVPYVALGLAGANNDASPPGDASSFKAFRALAPGAHVSADFRVSDPQTARGIVQFLFGMGAAVVPAYTGIEAP